MSFEGASFSCSPKYIYEELLKNPGLRHIWVFKNDCDFINNHSVINVKYKSLKYFYYMLTCNIIITNNISIGYIPFRKKQTVIGTWHGGGAYKKVGYDINKTTKQKKIYQALSKNVDFMLSSCQSFSTAMQNAYFIDKNKFISSGLPRNDILINKAADDLFDKIKSNYNIPKDDKIALYAPTFRGTIDMPLKDLKNIYDLDIQRLKNTLNKKYSGNWHVMFRAHYYLSNLNLFDDVIDVSNYKDMQELLYVSDVLINDYSSSMWDFSFTKKPIFIYASDKKSYIHDRDFYTPMYKWPFSIAENNDELEKNILEFNQEEYNKKLDKHHKDLGSFEKGTATQIVSKFITDILK